MASVLALLLVPWAADARSGSHLRGAFAFTGHSALPAGDAADSEDLIAFYDPVGTKLLATRKIGPRVFCTVACSVRATVKLDLPGKSDPKAAIFDAELLANRIYTATIAPGAADRTRLLKGLARSRLVVSVTAVDGGGRSDTDRRVFAFRSAG